MGLCVGGFSVELVGHLLAQVNPATGRHCVCQTLTCQTMRYAAMVVDASYP